MIHVIIIESQKRRERIGKAKKDQEWGGAKMV